MKRLSPGEKAARLVPPTVPDGERMEVARGIMAGIWDEGFDSGPLRLPERSVSATAERIPTAPWRAMSSAAEWAEDMFWRGRNIWHVTPTADEVAHEDRDCVCGPNVKPVKCEDGSVVYIVVHQALDGRE